MNKNFGMKRGSFSARIIVREDNQIALTIINDDDKSQQAFAMPVENAALLCDALRAAIKTAGENMADDENPEPRTLN